MSTNYGGSIDMKKIYLISENGHLANEAKRKNLLNRVRQTHETILGYEGNMYLLTPAASKAAGLYGIDDIIFQLFANFMRLYNSVRLDKFDRAAISIKRINALLLSFNKYKNDSLLNYDEIINASITKINDAWNSHDKDMLFDVVKNQLILYSKLVYDHLDFSELLINQNVRTLAGLCFNKESMQKFFDELPFGEWDDVTKQQYISIWQEIIERLRSIAMAENIRNIGLKYDGEIYGTFIVGQAHADVIKQYIALYGIEVILCHSYEAYDAAINNPSDTDSSTTSTENSDSDDDSSDDDNLLPNSEDLPQETLLPSSSGEVSKSNDEGEPSWPDSDMPSHDNTLHFSTSIAFLSPPRVAAEQSRLSDNVPISGM